MNKTFGSLSFQRVFLDSDLFFFEKLAICTRPSVIGPPTALSATYSAN